MRPNQIKRLVTAGQTALGTFCTSASPMLAETLRVAGYDIVIVDLQHGENGLSISGDGSPIMHPPLVDAWC